MSKAYKIIEKKINMGERKGETVYTVRPVSYGLLSSDDVARQIAAESTASPGDVKAVLDRYAYYVVENLKKGYDIELLGFGRLYMRFINGKAVSEESKATSKLIKSIVPGFRPSYTLLANGSRKYDLIPDKITLVKFGDEDAASEGDNSDSSDSTKTTTNDNSSTGTDSGNTGSGTGSDSGSGSGSDSGSGLEGE